MRSDSRQLWAFLQAHQVVPGTCVSEEAIVADFCGLRAFLVSGLLPLHLFSQWPM